MLKRGSGFRRTLIGLCSPLVFVLVAAGWNASPRAQSLEDALVAAYSSNPTLQAARGRLRATDELVPQALSGWRPTVNLTGSATRKRSETNSSGNWVVSSPESLGLTVTQPLYTGGQTTSGVAKAEAQVRAQRAQLSVTEQGVLLDAATAYMNVVRDQAVVDLDRKNERRLERQLEAAQDRFRVGEITRTDVAQAEARLSAATAGRIQAQGNLVSSRAVYTSIVGEAPGDLKEPQRVADLPTSETEAMSIGLAESPSIAAAKHTEAAARHDVRLTTGKLLPQVSLSGSLTRNNDVSTAVRRSDTASITASVTVPLYLSGAVTSQIRQFKQTASQRRIEVEETRRAVAESITRAWENLQTARASMRAITDQVRAAEIALEGVQQEASVGSRTTLDVLDAEQELLDGQVALVGAQRDEVVAGFSLQSSIGWLTAEKLKLPVEPFDAERHYRAVRNTWWSLAGPREPKK